MPTKLTPMMRQYLKIKEDNKDCIIFFRLGDFYEMFFEDAKEVSKILQITLTSREAGKGNEVPMCGVPFHAADNYITKLVKHGKKVAICEQIEDPAAAKGIVKREIVKVITPGTLVAHGLLDDEKNNYIISLNVDCDKYGLCYADISTGEFRLTEVDNKDDLKAEIYRISPSECVLPENLEDKRLEKELEKIGVTNIANYENWLFNYETSQSELKEHFEVDTLSGFGCDGKTLGVGAAGALLKYLKETQRSEIPNINTLSTYNISEYVELDRDSQRNLELLKNLYDRTKSDTLLQIVDKTETPMGRRKLVNWIVRPLLSETIINKRLDAVEELLENNLIRKDLKEILGDMYDIERLGNRVSLGSVNARDLISLANSLKLVPEVKELMKGFSSSRNKQIYEGLDEMKDMVELIDSSIVNDPPVTLKEGGLIKEGFNEDLDELREVVTGGKDWISNLQKKEIGRTGISSLKVGYNKVYGYYIEVTKPNLDAVPEDYIRKQTLVNSERFITPELKEHESKVLGAEEKSQQLEYEIFCDIREKIAEELERLQKVSNLISDIDVFSNLAEVAEQNDYCRPVVNKGEKIQIKESRHPVLEKMMQDKEFVPNDVFLDKEENRLLIITGPNMAGKSTYIRQVALIVLMAQMGSFVPAEEAEVGLVDKIFTRVGATDKLTQGMSTFMVEMVEAANILNNATSRSLIILDEVGRGTSTFDGVSIAWAVAEYIHSEKKGARTLFATHYHELTELSLTCEGAKNYNFAVREWNNQVIFLYKIQEGGCDKSFGIHVARLAGLPKRVIKRAREILSNLELDSLSEEGKPKFTKSKERKKEKDEKQEVQLDFISSIENQFIKEVKEIDVNKLTPVEALNLLNELKKKLEGTKYEQ